MLRLAQNKCSVDRSHVEDGDGGGGLVRTTGSKALQPSDYAGEARISRFPRTTDCGHL